MKLLFVTCLREDQHIVMDLFKQAHIDVYSASQTTGFRVPQVFAAADGGLPEEEPVAERFNSMFVFSFTSTAKANQVLLLAKKHNFHERPLYPVRVFIMSVESTSY